MYPWESGQALVCPFCMEAYVHPMLDRVEMHKTDGYTCPLETRGDWVAIPFWCEMCSASEDDPEVLDPTRVAFRLVIGFHKGQTFVGAI